MTCLWWWEEVQVFKISQWFLYDQLTTNHFQNSMSHKCSAPLMHQWNCSWQSSDKNSLGIILLPLTQTKGQFLDMNKLTGTYGQGKCCFLFLHFCIKCVRPTTVLFNMDTYPNNHLRLWTSSYKDAHICFYWYTSIFIFKPVQESNRQEITRISNVQFVHYKPCVNTSGSCPFLSWCQVYPPLGRSRSLANSNRVIPKLRKVWQNTDF